MNAKGEITIQEVGCPYCKGTQDVFVPVQIQSGSISADDTIQTCNIEGCGRWFVLQVTLEDTIEIFKIEGATP